MSWYQSPWVWGIGVGGVALVVLPGAAKAATQAVNDVVTRGAKLSYGTLGPGGVVVESPEALRLAASRRFGQDIPRDVYAAARMLRSEGNAQGALRVHVALNDLSTFRYAKNLFELLTYSTDPVRRGLYGSQYTAPGGGFTVANKRRYSTSKDPHAGDIKIAFDAIVEHDRGLDRAMGASKFIDKSSMGGAQSGTRGFAAVNKEWVQSGYKPFHLVEYGDDLVLYRKA